MQEQSEEYDEEEDDDEEDDDEEDYEEEEDKQPKPKRGRPPKLYTSNYFDILIRMWKAKLMQLAETNGILIDEKRKIVVYH